MNTEILAAHHVMPGDITQTSVDAEISGLQSRFNPDDYRAELAELQLTSAQETELLETLWMIMGTFARMGFSADVCGLIFNKFNEVSTSNSADAKLITSPSTETRSDHQGGGGDA